MLKETITYTDFDGAQRTDAFYFNLTKTELLKWDASVPGGIEGFMTRIAEDKDASGVIKVYEDLIERSYGEKSEDGKRFVKSDALFEAFSQSAAYDEILFRFMTDESYGTRFIAGLMPREVVNSAIAANPGLTKQLVAPVTQPLHIIQ